MLDEFGGGIDGAIERLDYLADLGINCLEIMPVSNVALTVDWGFLPIGYFGVDERFGKRADLQRLVDAAHQRGIAVIVDAVYGHTARDFPYGDALPAARLPREPVHGPFAKDLFGDSTDFARTFTRDFFFTVNLYWLAATTSTASATTAYPTTGTARWASATPTSSTTPTRRCRIAAAGGSLAALLRRRRRSI